MVDPKFDRHWSAHQLAERFAITSMYTRSHTSILLHLYALHLITLYFWVFTRLGFDHIVHLPTTCYFGWLHPQSRSVRCFSELWIRGCLIPDVSRQIQWLKQTNRKLKSVCPMTRALHEIIQQLLHTWTMGNAKAPVFPLPVSAKPMMSRPCKTDEKRCKRSLATCGHPHGHRYNI